jgi:hypothetical protein
MVKVLELFSGTHSIGKVAKARGYEVVSLDRDLPADINTDIMTWDYKNDYKEGEFDIITASPVCLWWSILRLSWVGRKLKAHGDKIITKEILQNDINIYGKPMVDKVREIIDYFKPKYYWIENPCSGSMKDYIRDLPYYDVDYCQYSNWGYRKNTRFWTNIKDFIPKVCDGINCVNMMPNTKKHSKRLGAITKGTNQTSKVSLHEKYRIPQKLIEDLFDKCI